MAGRLTNPLFFAPPSAISEASGKPSSIRKRACCTRLGKRFRSLVPGFLLACVLGVALGVLMGRSPSPSTCSNPYVTFSTIPPALR